MKILWLCGNSGLFRATSLADGGWIGALQTEFIHKYNVQLINVFEYCQKADIQIDGNIIYYPIYIEKKYKLLDKFYHKVVDKIFISKVLEIIHKEKPDIIQCWGSELGYGLISYYTNIPVILHIQGLLNPYLDAYFPPNYNLFNIWRATNYNVLKFLKQYYRPYLVFKQNAKREKKILQKINYVLGRTEWDYACSKLLAPESIYFYCSESLSCAIRNSAKWMWKESHRLIICSIMSNAIYKGVDVILRTAQLIKANYGIDYEWNIYGIEDISLHEKLTNINGASVNVCAKGRINASQIAEALRVSDVYCHLAYIENSPNSVCEAQYIGIPIVAAMVGGVDTILKNNSGILVPANDIYRTAQSIISLKLNKTYSEKLSKAEQNEAYRRHNGVEQQIKEIYDRILSNNSGLQK